jgi:hypothetical protein
MTAEAQRKIEQSWFTAVNKECTQGMGCAGRLKEPLERIKSAIIEGRVVMDAHVRELTNVRQHWSSSTCGHKSANSAACNYSKMPRELLPRLGRSGTVHPDTFPYITRDTLNDVHTMREIRRRAAKYGTNPVCQRNWRILSARLKTYATTGKGSIAEAIYCNDFLWRGQPPHELPL